MSRLTIASLLAVIVVAGLAAPASAARVEELIISSSDDPADGAAFFPIGTEVVYAIIEYEAAANEPIVVAVDGPGLPDLYSSAAKRYTGDGTDAVRIAGIDIYLKLVKAVDDYANEVKASAVKAQSQTAVHGYIEDAYRNASQSQTALALLLSLTEADALTSEQTRQMKEIRTAAAEVVSLAQQANALPAEDTAQKKALAADMSDPAETMVANAAALKQQSESLTSMPLPITGLEHEGYTVVAEVAKAPSFSRSFNIGGTETPGEERTTAPTSTRAASDDTGQDDTGARATAVTGTGSGDDNAGSSSGDESSGSESESGFMQVTGSESLGITSQTATPRSARSGAATEAPPNLMSSESSESRDEEQSSQPEIDESAPNEGVSEAPEGQPTWTPQALARAVDSVDTGGEAVVEDQPDAGTTGTGPNIYVLAAGALVLVGLALWMRRSL